LIPRGTCISKRSPRPGEGRTYRLWLCDLGLPVRARTQTAISAVKNLGQQYLAKNPWGYCGHGGTGVRRPASFIQGW